MSTSSKLLLWSSADEDEDDPADDDGDLESVYDIAHSLSHQLTNSNFCHVVAYANLVIVAQKWFAHCRSISPMFEEPQFPLVVGRDTRIESPPYSKSHCRLCFTFRDLARSAHCENYSN